MAASLALRRTSSSTATLFSRFLTPVRTAAVAPSGTRSFNTNAQMNNFDDDLLRVDDDLRDGSVSRRRESVPSFLTDVFDPFSPPTLSQMLNLRDQIVENPLLSAFRGIGAGVGSRRGWDVKELQDGLRIRMDMPGLDKENVKVSVEQNTLVIRGEGEKESKDDDSRRRYSSRLDLPPDVYKLDEIKAEMKNGVLKVIVPKAKKDEKKDAFEVKID